MSGTVENARVWLNADAYVAPVGTDGPANLVEEWDPDWELLGLLSEDGMTEARQEEVTDFYAWGGRLVRTTRSKHKRTIRITALEDNPVVFGLVNPGSLAETASGVTTRTVKSPISDPRAFGLELHDGDITKRRIIPRGEITNVGEVLSDDSSMTMFELTITVYPTTVGDEDEVLWLDITDDPAADESGS